MTKQSQRSIQSILENAEAIPTYLTIKESATCISQQQADRNELHEKKITQLDYSSLENKIRINLQNMPLNSGDTSEERLTKWIKLSLYG